MAKISVIIPCYNVEKYIDECINSLCNQDYGDVEIIAVDDGSTDMTGKKLDEWALRDYRVVVYHSKNNGRSVARNIGIEISHGEYFSFVDSDDTVKPNYISALYKALVDSDADFSEVSQYCNILGTEEYKFIPAVREERLYNGYTLYAEDVYLDKDKTFFVNGITVTGKLYKRELFGKVRFPGGKIIEDCWVFPEILSQCKRIAVLPDCLYFYRQRENSTTRELSSYLVESKIEAWLHNRDWWKENNSPEHDRLVADVEKYLCHYMYNNSGLVSQDKRDYFKKQYFEMVHHILFTKYLPLKTKFKYLTFASPIRVWGITRK